MAYLRDRLRPLYGETLGCYSGAGGHWVGAPAYSAVAPSLPVSNTGYTGYPAPVASGWGYPAPRQGGAFYPMPGYGGWGQRVMYPR